ncbi:hypothetical protein MJH54_34615, partial [Salmonella enterica subsp. enterica serovar Montevideo]|nr:hypothetical protein [Salmonella enterica subsp. enterica serovar Montevideo]
FFSHGVSFDRPIIASCGSGVTAAVVVLALATLDVPDVTLYDGDWRRAQYTIMGGIQCIRHMAAVSSKGRSTSLIG